MTERPQDVVEVPAWAIVFILNSLSFAFDEGLFDGGWKNGAELREAMDVIDNSMEGFRFK